MSAIWDFARHLSKPMPALYEITLGTKRSDSKGALKHVSEYAESTQCLEDVTRLTVIVAAWAKKLPRISPSHLELFQKISDVASIGIGLASIPAILSDSNKLAYRIKHVFKKMDCCAEYVAHAVKSCFLKAMSIGNNAIQLALLGDKTKIVSFSSERLGVLNMASNLTGAILDVSDLHDQFYKLHRKFPSYWEALCFLTGARTAEQLNMLEWEAEKTHRKQIHALVTIAKDCTTIAATAIDVAGTFSRRVSESSAFATAGLFLQTTSLSLKVASHFYKESVL